MISPEIGVGLRLGVEVIVLIGVSVDVFVADGVFVSVEVNPPKLVDVGLAVIV
jgi:hypothetical protein